MYKPQTYEVPNMSAEECKRAIETEHIALIESREELRLKLNAIFARMEAERIEYKKTALVLNDRIAMCKQAAQNAAKEEEAL